MNNLTAFLLINALAEWKVDMMLTFSVDCLTAEAANDLLEKKMLASSLKE